MANQCIQLLIDSDSEESVTVAEVLRRDCQMPALKQPADHSGDERTAMHQVTLSETQCRLLLAVIQRAKGPINSPRYPRQRSWRLAESCESCEDGGGPRNMLAFSMTQPEQQTSSQSGAIRKILIANRGAIARRIVRACNELGLESVVVHTSVDAHAPYIQEASEAYPLSGLRPADSYLDQDQLLSIARTSADAVHPGYGFLSENAGFAQVGYSTRASPLLAPIRHGWIVWATR